jgi:hypothetical protein
MKIQPIVEGHGEVSAVPVLMRRLRDQAGVYDIDIGKPIRRKLSELVTREGIQRAVRLAAIQQDCGAILILFDSEDSCPRELAPQLQEWAVMAAGFLPCSVVLAYREYETWFLSAIESLRGQCGIRLNADPPLNPESRRGAKEALERYMPPGCSYHETIDQARLTAHLDLNLAYQRSRSFRKLVKAFGLMAGVESGAWPPGHWTQGT